MKKQSVNVERLEARLAVLLNYGSVLACLLIAMGLILQTAGWHGVQSSVRLWSGIDGVTAGIALFILLPVCRIFLMLLDYLHTRDYRYAAIAAVVLLIIAVGCVAGFTVG